MDRASGAVACWQILPPEPLGRLWESHRLVRRRILLGHSRDDAGRPDRLTLLVGDRSIHSRHPQRLAKAQNPDQLSCHVAAIDAEVAKGAKADQAKIARPFSEGRPLARDAAALLG